MLVACFVAVISSLGGISSTVVAEASMQLIAGESDTPTEGVLELSVACFAPVVWVLAVISSPGGVGSTVVAEAAGWMMTGRLLPVDVVRTLSERICYNSGSKRWVHRGDEWIIGMEPKLTSC